MPYIDDFAFTGRGDTLLAARDDNQVGLVRPDGTHTAVLTAADGVQTPTSIAVHVDTVYVPSAAHLTDKDPNLLLARLDRRAVAVLQRITRQALTFVAGFLSSTESEVPIGVRHSGRRPRPGTAREN